MSEGIWTLELCDSSTGGVSGEKEAVRSHWGERTELPLS